MGLLRAIYRDVFHARALKKKASELERYSRDFVGGFALRRCRNSIRRYLAAPKREFRSQFPLFPLYESKVRAFPCRLVFYTENERGDTRRYSTAQK